MTTLPTLLVVLLVSLFPVAPIVALILIHRTETRLLRIFSERSGVSVASMENKPKPEPMLALPKDMRKRVSIPIPGAQLFRKEK